MQQLSLQHLNMDVRYNKIALAELYDCMGGLFHLGLNVITFRPSTRVSSYTLQFFLVQTRVDFYRITWRQ